VIFDELYVSLYFHEFTSVRHSNVLRKKNSRNCASLPFSYTVYYAAPGGCNVGVVDVFVKCDHSVESY